MDKICLKALTDAPMILLSRLYPVIPGVEYICNPLDMLGHFRASYLARSANPQILRTGAAGDAVTAIAAFAGVENC